MKHRISAGALTIKNSEVLLVHCYKESVYDFWVAPGGGVIGREDIHTAAKRETAEETGLEIATARLAYIEELVTPETRHCKFWFFSKLIGGTISVDTEEAKSENIVEAKFLPRESLQDKIVFPLVLKSCFWQDLELNFPEPKYLGVREMKFY